MSVGLQVFVLLFAIFVTITCDFCSSPLYCSCDFSIEFKLFSDSFISHRFRIHCLPVLCDYLSLALQPFIGPWPFFFSFLIFRFRIHCLPVLCDYLSLALQPFIGPWRFFSVSWSCTQSVGLLEQWISPSQGRYLRTGQHKQNERTQTSMSQVGFEPTISVFKWAMTVHALDRAAAVIGCYANK
jgi:hypothetical protein